MGYYKSTDPAKMDNEDLVSENENLRELLAELFDGDCCDCEAGPGEAHDDGCLQVRIANALD